MPFYHRTMAAYFLLLIFTLIGWIGATSVEVTVTTSDQTKLLFADRNPTFAASAHCGSAAITVNPATTYQQVLGFGAALTQTAASLLHKKLPQLQGLFGNLSLLRLPIAASEYTVGAAYSYDDLPRGQTDPTLSKFSAHVDEADIVPVLHQLISGSGKKLRIIASPWSAPAWMKSSGVLQGGTLLPQHFSTFANYHVKFIQAYAGAGIPIYAVTPQNEPFNQQNSYPTMGMTDADQATFIGTYLGPALAKANLGTKIFLLDHNWSYTADVAAVLNNAKAAAFIYAVGFHCYAGDVSAQSAIHSKFPNTHIWFTECSGGDWSPNFASNLPWNVQTLGINNFRNWGESLLFWNLALDQNAGPHVGGCANCRGVVTVNTATGAVTKNVEYYVLAHFANFVQPGAKRIDSTNSNAFPNVAFRNPDGSTALVVLANGAGSVTVAYNGQCFSYTFSGAGVATFKWHS